MISNYINLELQKLSVRSDVIYTNPEFKSKEVETLHVASTDHEPGHGHYEAGLI